MNKNNSQFKKIKTKGFTLVEILVVLGLFSFIMTLATVSLVTTQSVNTKIQEIQPMLSNMNLSMESITRNIRYGSVFNCSMSTSTAGDLHLLRRNCKPESGGGTVLFMKPVDYTLETDRDAYYTASSTTHTDRKVIYKNEYRNNDSIHPIIYQMTSDEIDIKSLVFYVSGASSTPTDPDVTDPNLYDYEQPLVTISISGETKPIKLTKNASSTKFILETSVSSRVNDN